MDDMIEFLSDGDGVPIEIFPYLALTTPFVGRTDAIAAIDAAFGSGARLVTVVGAAGLGKTRLALEWMHTPGAREVSAGRIWWADLSAATTDDDIAAALMAAVELAPEPRTWLVAPAGKRLRASLESAGRGLLLIDNVEQVVEVAARVVATLLEDHPEVRVLATSRRRLRLRAERFVALEPLDRVFARQLFLDRLWAAGMSEREMVADATTIASAAEDLDGIPLAIELAAPRCAALGAKALRTALRGHLGDLRTRFHDLPERQVTLEAAVAWSWTLLEPAARQALARLSVFRGTFDYEAAAAVMGPSDGEARPDAATLLELLCDHSLVQIHRGRDRAHAHRFRLLMPIASFAAERLAESDTEERAARERHAEHFAAVATRLKGEIATPAERDALAQLAAERPNIVAAHAYARERHPAWAARLALSGQAVWVSLGPEEGASELLASAVDCAARAADPGLLARALRQRGADHCKHGRVDRGRADFAAAAEQARAVGDAVTEVLTALDLAQCDLVEGRADAVAGELDALVKRAEAVGGEALALKALMVGGAAAADAQAFATARRHFERAAALPASGGRYHAVVAHTWLALLDCEEGRAEQAWARIGLAVELAAARPRDVVALSAWLARGSLLLLRDQPREALSDLRATSRAAVEGGMLELHGYAELWIALAHLSLDELEEAEDALARAYAHLRVGLHRGRDALEIAAAVVDGARGVSRIADPPGGHVEANQLARLVMRVVDAWTARSRGGVAPVALRVARDGSWFAAPGGEPVDLRRRTHLARVLAHLAAARQQRPGVVVQAAALLAAGWPGLEASAPRDLNRVYVAVAHLRKIGLEALLLSGSAGYQLSERVPLVLGAPSAPGAPRSSK